jgi:hypothetical protein
MEPQDYKVRKGQGISENDGAQDSARIQEYRCHRSNGVKVSGWFIRLSQEYKVIQGLTAQAEQTEQQAQGNLN